MDEQKPVETPPTVYLFGHRERDERPQLTSGVARWLRGEDVELTKQQQRELFAEFTAMERYRQELLSGIMRISKRLSEQGAESVASIESPAVDGADVFWRGFAAGQVEAYGTSAAAVSELHVIAALGVDR